jgi:ketosteroid isomerase-like protein
MNTEQVAKRLVELCREGNYTQAQEELFAPDAVNIEMEGMPEGPMGGAKGLDAIKQKGRAFGEMLEAVHSNEVSDAVIAGNWFSVSAIMDATMKGRGRVQMREICVYHVRDGKIDREQFFYDM